MDAPDNPIHSQPKQIVRVSIFNQTYSVSTAGDPRDTERLAREVDDLMSSIARRAGNLDTARTAVLACLHLADRLRAVESELESLRASIVHKTRDFATLLDSALGQNGSEESHNPERGQDL